jgi:hypothetical protein
MLQAAHRGNGGGASGRHNRRRLARIQRGKCGQWHDCGDARSLSPPHSLWNVVFRGVLQRARCVVWQTACTRRAGTCSSPHTQALPEITPARAWGRMSQFQPNYSQMRRNEQFSAKFTTACCGGPWRNAARNECVNVRTNAQLDFRSREITGLPLCHLARKCRARGVTRGPLCAPCHLTRKVPSALVIWCANLTRKCPAASRHCTTNCSQMRPNE